MDDTKKPKFLQVISRSEEKLLDISADIVGNPPTSQDFAFTHAVLCQVGLPRSKVEGREFMRHSGDAWINVQAGYLDEGKGAVAQPVPYGAMPRLALAWASTYALRHKTREIPIGGSAKEFIRLMLGDDGGGRQYTTLRKQLHALAACRLQIGYKGRTFNGQPIEQFDAWLVNRSAKGQAPLWPGVLLLSQSYFNELQNGAAVPLDNRALHALRGSALALDVYLWLARRLHYIPAKNPVFLRWQTLREQFGQEYTDIKNFKRKFLSALADVLVVYPTANVSVVTGGLLLACSPPPISKKIIPASNMKVVEGENSYSPTLALLFKSKNKGV